MNTFFQTKTVTFSLLVILLFLIFLFAKHVFQFQFGGYDLSPLIDLCTRLNRGEVPGKDFISTFPISFLFWIKLNLFVFHNNYNFLLYSGYTHFAICTIFISALLRQNKHLNSNALLIIIILIIAIPELVTNHIFHSTFSQYSCSVLLISVSNIILNKKITNLNYVVFALFVGLSMFAKQNIGILCIVLCSAVLIACYLFKVITQRELLVSSLTFICSIIVYVFTIHSILKINYDAFVKAYTSVLGRAIPSKHQIKDIFYPSILNPNLILTLISATFSLILFIQFLKLKSFSTNFKILIWFIFFIQVIGYYAFVTNWDIKFNDFPLIGISTIIFLKTILDDRFLLKSSYYLTFMFIFLFATYFGIIRYRMYCVGYGSFYEDSKLYKINDGYFTGLNVGKRLYVINNEINSFKKNRLLPIKTFFGPRMEFGYTQYTVQSPAQMPLWWHPGSSYNINDEKMIVLTFINLNFDKLIFLKDDRTRMPLAILDYINKNFHALKSSPYLDVYVR